MICFKYHPHLNTLSEKQLIKLAKKNGKLSIDAKNALLKKYQPYIHNLLLRYPEHLKYDLEMLAYVGLLKAIDLFDISKDVLLITFAQHYIKKEITTFIKHELEKIKKETSELIIEDSKDVEYSIYEETSRYDTITAKIEKEKIKIDENFNKRYIGIFLQELTHRQRTVVNLVYYLGFSPAEVAKRLNISKPRVNQILNRVKELGKERLSYLSN